ncbi:glycan-binding surface protein [Bacteroides sp.]|jgi:hypothetical protein|uniref:glycan-binding surface protein n=1 Tax=Bacteroides sp. TaxID=29523 RepID=UPI00258EB7C9|nr:glycan-binding surface protein [Bacteroides sp.]
MKKTNNILWNFLLTGMLLFPLLGVYSCSDDDDDVRIYSVWSNMLGEEAKQITSVYTGNWIRLDGCGFSGLRAIYCNGMRVTEYNATYMDDAHLTFRVPSGVPIANEVEDESLRNTIKVITSHGEGIYRNFIFKDINKMPGITDVSFTLPESGDFITIIGKYLNGATAVYFPGNDGNEVAVPFIEGGEDMTVTEDGTRIRVKVPQGVGERSGSIRVELADMGENYYTPNYMFYDKAMFVHDYDGTTALDYGLNESLNSPKNCKYYPISSITIPSLPEGARDYIFCMPEPPATLPIATGNDDTFGFFRFSTGKQLAYLVEHSNGEFARETDARKVALQADIYINQPWSTGVVAWRMDKSGSKGNGASAWNVAAWANNKPYDFAGGWKTVTFPIHTKYSILGEAIDAWSGSKVHSLFAFLNYNILNDANLTNIKQVDNFQLFVTNLRLVPYETPGE